MKLLTYDETIAWLTGKNAELVQISFAIFRVRLIESCGDTIAIGLPGRESYAVELSTVFARFEGIDSVNEYLVVLADSGMGCEEHERVGETLLNSIRAKGVGNPDPRETPFHVLGSTELLDIQALLFVGLALQWEMYLFPDTGSFLMKISHDGYLQCWARESATLASIKAELRLWPNIEPGPV